MITLAALVAELQSEVPAVNSVPTTAQYTQAIKDAVAEFSRRCGRKKTAALNIISGTAAYNLPADFLKLIALESFASADGVIISNTGIIPVSADWDETYDIIGQTITFYPTPAYTLSRDYEYKAGWVLTGASGSETYATMGDDEAQIVMIKARGLALEKISNAQASSGGLRYSFGAVSADKSVGSESLTNKIFAAHGNFTQACDRYNGAVGMA